jgi:hypothetical protein
MALLQIVLDIGTIAIVVTVVLFIIGIIVNQRNKLAFLRKARYRLCNKDFKIDISGKKKYKEFKPSIAKLKAHIEQDFKKSGQRIEIFGNGFLQIQINNMQAPYLITFAAEVADRDLETGRIEAYIDYFGTLDCRYNDKNKKIYFVMLERLFKLIEDTFDIRPRYTNYHLSAALSEIGIIWDDLKEKDVGNSATLRLGINGLEVDDEERATTLYDICKKNLHRVKPATNNDAAGSNVCN